MKKKIIISGINLVSGGALSIFRDCLIYLKEAKLIETYEVVALVHDRKLFKNISIGITYLEYPLSKKSWFIRCFYEYIYFYFLSKQIAPLLWLSLHDMSPNVIAERKAVYCHNPSPFYSLKIMDILVDKKFTLFNWFYSFLYRINIKKNTHVIVQQQWLRDEFVRRYKLKNVVVAHPKLPTIDIPKQDTMPATFIYPTFPRIFKNIEVICEAFKLIDDIGAKVFITIDGSENEYAQRMVKKYCYLKSIKFIGVQTRETIFDYYAKVAALIFPSRLETWGMPMSEFAMTTKPIFASETRFCRETLNGYKNAVFFKENDAVQLADLIKRFVCEQEFIPNNNAFVNDLPYAQDWQALFDYLLENNQKKH